MVITAPKKLIAIGIDPGLADTGFGVIVASGSKLACLEYGSLKTKAKTDLPSRLADLYQQVSRLLDKYQPDLIGIEQLFFCRNVTTAFQVGQARGVVMLAIGQRQVPCLEFTPLQIKQGVAGYGQADKQQIQKMVKLMLGLKEIPKPDDAADGLAAALCALQGRSILLANNI